MSETPVEQDAAGLAAGRADRRATLKLGAAGVATMLTVKPAIAATMGSVLNCQIPVPDPARAGGHIAADGSVVPAGTPGAFPPAVRPFTGEEVKRALGGSPLPGASYSQSQAYINYIRRLQMGQSGFTCFASLQMPR